MNEQWVWDMFMYAGLAFVGWCVYCLITDKPIIPWLSKRLDKNKKKTNKKYNKKEDIELDVPIKTLLGIKEFHGNLCELLEEKNGTRIFVGIVKTEPINYLLRSHEEQVETDTAYEHMLASISLGPGREVEFATHVSSRPIDLGDQLRPYEKSFPNLGAGAQRYAESIFFPFLKSWQQSVDEFDYQGYFIVRLRYTAKMLENLTEESILVKARNEFGRLANNIRLNYKRMGGRCKISTNIDLYEALYFALNKQQGSMNHFRSLMEKEGMLSPFVMSDFSRESYRYMEDETDNEDKAMV
ncbi:hypothetical protein [Paenibacillus sp. IITD108]|uniref:hypothetical protein n=1 Tax=Paenibacillus sp. IITD108 TaxID=3116649 RepID=UPI002F413F07